MTIMLTLDGEGIPLDNMTLSVSQTLADTDVSGRSAMADSAEEGVKAMELKVSGQLSYTNEATAARLFELSRMTEKDGSRKVFRIGNGTARIIKCRQVKFAGTLSLSEQINLMAWNISFTLREVKSVAEQQESRTQRGSSSAQQVDQAQFQQALIRSNKVAL
ncbi:hypothetical protein HWQ46_09935 [Shewanella sp. D64]|uniref:baseplate complex protein n=1 Tax=unclassified Shewanella TaxID=196818 RepID=UPI0022BA6420|nr:MULTISPECIES: hypothetical protein [unclassified Shewanella]MEC4725863.1 hypothetical protein [Shewanella sp. D64]MEC4737118.1 hypothetical protein [Shewanella sp. E94]WBJ93575.1 hypothetical protein HWQ47_16775 [Shewanella sp. MTB7]WBJ95689.1 hypothetical protein HWQ47_00700 [Shewanella sp. MTB7]